MTAAHNRQTVTGTVTGRTNCQLQGGPGASANAWRGRREVGEENAENSAHIIIMRGGGVFGRLQVDDRRRCAAGRAERGRGRALLTRSGIFTYDVLLLVGSGVEGSGRPNVQSSDLCKVEIERLWDGRLQMYLVGSAEGAGRFELLEDEVPIPVPIPRRGYRL